MARIELHLIHINLSSLNIQPVNPLECRVLRLGGVPLAQSSFAIWRMRKIYYGS